MSQNREQIRAFIAVEIPEEVKAFLKDLSDDLRSSGADVRWVKPHGVHLTLKFLGNVEPNVVRRLEETLSPAFTGCRPTEIAVSGVGAFPNLRRPRVIWVGLEDESGFLAPLAARVDDLVEPLGFKKEKRGFTPHLTLGRVRSGKNSAPLTEAVRQKMDLPGPRFTAKEAILFQSILKPTGAQYIPLHRFPFSGE